MSKEPMNDQQLQRYPLPPLHGKISIINLLELHGLHPTKKRGQNFVVDPNTVTKIVADANVKPGDHVIEVGPGLGSLTLALLHAGAHVTAIELDHGLARTLKNYITTYPTDEGMFVTVEGRTIPNETPHLQIITADAVSIDWQKTLADITKNHPHLEGKPVTMVANLPYNVATPIVMEAIKSQIFSDFYVMVQKEVGQRWCATEGKELGAISLKLALFSDVKITGPIAKQSFFPMPHVDSVMVRITPKTLSLNAQTVPLEIKLFAAELIDIGFNQRRKTLRNTLLNYRPTKQSHIQTVFEPDAIVHAFEESNIAENDRAEQITIPQWIALASIWE